MCCVIVCITILSSHFPRLFERVLILFLLALILHVILNLATYKRWLHEIWIRFRSNPLALALTVSRRLGILARALSRYLGTPFKTFHSACLYLMRS